VERNVASGNKAARRQDRYESPIKGHGNSSPKKSAHRQETGEVDRENWQVPIVLTSLLDLPSFCASAHRVREDRQFFVADRLPQCIGLHRCLIALRLGRLGGAGDLYRGPEVAGRQSNAAQRLRKMRLEIMGA
jgi:hypothetical protein